MGRIAAVLIGFALAALAGLSATAQTPPDASKKAPAAKEAPKPPPPAVAEPKREAQPPAAEAKQETPPAADTKAAKAPAAAAKDRRKAGSRKAKRRVAHASKRKRHVRARQAVVARGYPLRAYDLHHREGSRLVQVNPAFARRYFGGYFASGRNDCSCERRRHRRS